MSNNMNDIYIYMVTNGTQERNQNRRLAPTLPRDHDAVFGALPLLSCSSSLDSPTASEGNFSAASSVVESNVMTCLFVPGLPFLFSRLPQSPSLAP